MNDQPFVSICIPAYQRVNYLKRLLESMVLQSFKDFEVIITDDSRDESVCELQKKYDTTILIRYQKNPVQLGTPENWNEAVRLSRGHWIKIMHDDDWFAFPNSLEKFVQLVKANPKAGFMFSGSSFVRDDKVFDRMRIGKWESSLLSRDPLNLYYKNFIGPPSSVIYRNDKKIWYDKEMKWLVDIDFYIRFLQSNPNFAFTTEPLINVGYSSSQVTEQVFYDKAIFVKENLMLMQKQPHSILRRIWNYDYSWRMMRNYRINNEEELKELFPQGAHNIPAFHKYILQHQKYIPRPVLKIGVLSKIFMIISFFINRLRK